MNTTHNNCVIILQIAIEKDEAEEQWKVVEMLNYTLSCVMLREHFAKDVSIVKDI